MFFALLAHLQIKTLKIPVMPVNQVTVEISPLLAKGDQVFRVELKLWRKMKRLYVMDLQSQGRPAPLAFRLFCQVLTLYCVPVRTSQVSGLAKTDIVN